MIYERLILMRDLLAEDGSIYVHMGPKIAHLIEAVVREVFGGYGQGAEITWKRVTAHGDSQRWGVIHDAIIWQTKSDKFVWNPQFDPYDESYIKSKYSNKTEDGRLYRLDNLTSPHARPNMTYEWRGHAPPAMGWRYELTTMERLYKEGRIELARKPGGRPQLRRFLDEGEGVPAGSIWADISPVNSQAREDTEYDTQKPTALLERIISASSNPNDLVADFFAGSGTTAAVAEKLGRKWIATDLGKFAIHTTRKRMIGVQRALKAEGKDYRAFEILNLGKYKRQAFVDMRVSGAAHVVSGGVNPLTSCAAPPDARVAAKEAAFVDLILKAYKATAAEGLRVFHGKKAGRMVVIGPVNLPVTRLFVEEIILECRQKRITRVDLLGFEFEMGLFPHLLEEAKAKGIDLAPKYIPAEVFDKRAVEKEQVVFHDVAAIEVKPIVKGNTLAVRLTDFLVYYSQDSAKAAAESLKEKGSKIVVDRGQIVKISKDKAGIVTKEKLTKHWTDWVDYWSVDFDFESKREIIREQNEAGEWEEKWTGDYVFENEWQSFRTKKDRSLELTSAAKETDKKRLKIAVKVVDIFGKDTMTIIDVGVKEPRTK